MLKDRAENDASYGDMFADAVAEIERPQKIIVTTENRLLCGGSDKELIDILRTAWQTPNVKVRGAPQERKL